MWGFFSCQLFSRIVLNSVKFVKYASLENKLLYGILQLQAGGLHKAKKQKIVQIEDKINLLKDELTNGNRIIASYISTIRHCAVSFNFSI